MSCCNTSASFLGYTKNILKLKCPIYRGQYIVYANTKAIFLDSGGYTNYYLQNANVGVKKIDKTCIEDLFCKQCESSSSLTCYPNTQELNKITTNPHVINFVQDMPIDPRKVFRKSMELLLGDTFAHYKAGSDWNKLPKDIRDCKTSVLNNFISTILQDN